MKTNPFGLMAVNRSVAEVRAKPTRFRLASAPMPRFGWSGAAPESVSASLDSPFRPGNGAERPDQGRGKYAVTATPVFPRPVAAAVPIAPSQERHSGRAPARGFMGLPSRWFGRRRSRDRALVQGELSLETVRVVRNDLRDADYEIVRPARAVASRLRQADPVDAPPLFAMAAWRRWLGAFFRMGS